MMLLLIVSVIVLLIVLNVPVAYAMLAGVAIYFIANPSFMNETLTQRVVSGVESFPLLGIVYFYHCWRFDELYRNYTTNACICQTCNRTLDWRIGESECVA